jgi:hypothetical protein
MFSTMDAIETPIKAALALFEATLADVRFADIDAKTLAHTASEVEDAALAVAAAQAALDSARGVLQERQGTLLEQVQRAIAYARVYAESDDALRQQFDAISLPRLARRPRGVDPAVSGPTEAQPTAPRRRGRPPKTAIAEQLVVDVSAAAANAR